MMRSHGGHEEEAGDTSPAAPIAFEAENLQEFKEGLTALSVEHHLGIGDEPVLFAMECGLSGDFERTYTGSEESKLEFA